MRAKYRGVWAGEHRGYERAVRRCGADFERSTDGAAAKEMHSRSPSEVGEEQYPG